MNAPLKTNPSPLLDSLPSEEEEYLRYLETIIPNVELIESDGEPLETDWHRRAIDLLLEILWFFWRDRQDFHAAGNMFLYYDLEQSQKRNYRGPDFFVVKGTTRKPRGCWTVWKEGGLYPHFILELLSPTTAKVDRTTKRQIYEQVFRTPEYFMYDPESRALEGLRRGTAGRYEPVPPNEKGWVWSEELNLFLGVWDGPFQGISQPYLRFFHADGQLVLKGDEFEQKARETEQQAREAAEAEVARLKSQLAELQRGPGKAGPS